MAKLDLKSLPPYARIIIAVLPAIVLAALIIILMIRPKQKEIKTLDAQIDKQNNEIAVDEAKAAQLPSLIIENKKLEIKWEELKQRLPEESEVSGLLKQVSDLSLSAGLDMRSWRPRSKRTYPGGVVYEIPVSVMVRGTYHDFGGFLSSLTRLDRIVNVGNIKMGGAKTHGESSDLSISFTASTFSAIPEKPGRKGKGGRKS